MTITELKYIIALSKEKHFGKAAQSVYVSQPTLSIGIKKIEKELGVQIFERLSNTVLPTPIGLRIIEAAADTLLSTDVIREIADETKNELIGNIKLGAIYTVCPYLLPKIIPDLQNKAPNLRLYIEENHTKKLINQLKDGYLDIALISLPLPKSNLFEVRPIFTEEFCVIMPKGHLLEKHSKISQNQLHNERIFLLGNGNCFRDQVLQSFPEFIPYQYLGANNDHFVQGGSLATIQMMVGGGLGISIFPKIAISDSKDIVVRPFVPPAPKRQIALIWRKSFTRKKIIDVIEESILNCHHQ